MPVYVPKSTPEGEPTPDGYTVVEDLPAGRYYARWIECDAHARHRLRCNCGYPGPWHESLASARQDRHEAH